MRRIERFEGELTPIEDMCLTCLRRRRRYSLEADTVLRNMRKDYYPFIIIRK